MPPSIPEQLKQWRRSSLRIIAAETELHSCARELAKSLAASFVGPSREQLRKGLHTALSAPDASVMLVARVADLTDDLLVVWLDAIERCAMADRVWDSVPEFSVLTGRTIAEIEARCARIIEEREASDMLLRFVHVHLSGASVQIQTVSTDAHGRPILSRTTAEGDALAALLRQPAFAVAYDTHGGEACAKGGGGMVLCGRSSQPRVEPPGTPGILACGRGHVCPRGPFPLPMRDIPAQAFLLASCKGLRLADGSLSTDYNLGLSFLDGSGQAYVSSLGDTRGTWVAGKIFIAALASGVSLGETTAQINAAIVRMGIDSPHFIALGPATLVAAPIARPQPQRIASTEAGILDVDAPDLHFVELLIEDERVAALVRDDNLLLTVPSSEEEILWFARPETAPVDSDGSAGQRVRVFLYRFPGSIGRVQLQIGDLREARDRVLAWRHALMYWLELWRSFGLAASQADAYKSLSDASDEAADLLARMLPGLGRTSAGRARLQAPVQIMQSLAAVASEQIVADLAIRLSGGSFWLTNESLLCPVERTGHVTCNACGKLGSERLVRHPLRGSRRQIISCRRCGITFDGDSAGGLRGIALRVPDVIPKRADLDVEVELDVQKEALGRTLRVYACLSMHGASAPVDAPEPGVVALTSVGPLVMSFRLNVPESIIPHQHFLKVLAATEQELAFACRPFFIE